MTTQTLELQAVTDEELQAAVADGRTLLAPRGAGIRARVVTTGAHLALPRGGAGASFGGSCTPRKGVGRSLGRLLVRK